VKRASAKAQKHGSRDPLAEWKSAVGSLCSEIEAWAKGKRWLVDRHEKTIEESGDSYSLPELFVHTPQGRIVVEPVAMNVADAEGRVDLVAFPSFQRLMLLREKGDWVLRTSDGLPWPQPWGPESFEDLMLMLSAA
jgi:hypothetical protein